MSTILITGATGFLGREVVRALLARAQQDEMILLVRARDAAELDARVARLGAAWGTRQPARLRALRGDVGEPRLGLDEEPYRALASSVDRVLHVAASTRFDLPLHEARRRNVAGTQHVLALCRDARAAGREGRLDHVSTAYVAGTRVDRVAEDAPGAPPAFRNSYEQSKFEAEEVCRAAWHEVPIAIHRPSIIVGSAATGSTSRYHGFYEVFADAVRVYGPWKKVLTRLIPLPFEPDCPIDLVPVDYVARAIATLFDRSDAAGRCYHLAAGEEGACTVRELVTRVCDHFAVSAPRYLRPQRPGWRLAAAAAPLLGVVAPRLRRRAAHLLPYTWQNPRFDTTNARAAGLAPPPVADYLRRILDYAHGDAFGRGGAVARSTRDASTAELHRSARPSSTGA